MAVAAISASSLRRQAVGIEALLAVIEWGDTQQAATSLGIAAHTLTNRLYDLYQRLDVLDRTQATVLLWPLIRDGVVVRDRHGRSLIRPLRRREDQWAA